MTELEHKQHMLEKRLREMGRVLVAYSAGVDSTLLLKIAHDALGPDALAVFAKLPSTPHGEPAEAVRFCADEGIELVTFEFDQLGVEGLADNPPERCYLCKHALFTEISSLAAARSIGHVLDGTNADDVHEHRPGAVALVELGVESPLRDCGLSKDDIRELSRQQGLGTWNKPSSPCLVTRLPHGERITQERLEAVACAEQALAAAGIPGARVRVHGDLARIETVPELFGALVEPDTRALIASELHELGFRHVALDLDGYRIGSMGPR